MKIVMEYVFLSVCCGISGTLTGKTSVREGITKMSRRITVLIIDDNKLIRAALKHCLWLEGFEVYLAKNGRAGLKMACRKQPELIFSIG